MESGPFHTHVEVLIDQLGMIFNVDYLHCGENLMDFVC